MGVLIKEGVRISQRVPKRTHQKGKFVSFKGKMYAVQKVSRKGVHLAPVKREKGKLLSVDVKRTKFVPEKEYSGKAVAYFIPIIFGL